MQRLILHVGSTDGEILIFIFFLFAGIHDIVDFGDHGFQPTSELDPYEADSDELQLDLTEA